MYNLYTIDSNLLQKQILNVPNVFIFSPLFPSFRSIAALRKKVSGKKKKKRKGKEYGPFS